MLLEWAPQAAFADYFYTSTAEIIKRRTVFRDELEFFVPYGGRGSGKTYTFADAVVVESSLRPVRVLVTRELQESIEESIKSEIENAIESRNLGHFFDIQKNVIIGANGSRFIFKGLKNNITKLKSIADVDIVLCEESESITKRSWDKLLPSIRPRDKIHRGGTPIVIVIFNPDNELDDTYQRWVMKAPDACLSKLINWYDNEHFPPHLDRQRLHFKRTRPPRDYQHEWEGKPTGQGGDIIIDLEWIKAARYASQHPLFKRDGGKKSVGYDPAGQGKDFNATTYTDGNVIEEMEEWLKSDDLREATKRAFVPATRHHVDQFRYDECGGLGDGVDVFVKDIKADQSDPAVYSIARLIDVHPFNAGSAVLMADQKINPEIEKSKTWGETYANAKAQSWGIIAQRLYSTYRLVKLGETDMNASDLISIDIESEDMFIKLCWEWSSPLWVKSKTNSKKRVEDKKDTEKRTGQPSGNLADSANMCYAPVELDLAASVF